MRGYGRTRWRGVPYTHTRRYAAEEWVRARRNRLWWNQIKVLRYQCDQLREILARAARRHREMKRRIERLESRAVFGDAFHDALYETLVDIQSAHPQLAEELWPDQVTEVNWPHLGLEVEDE